MIKIRFLYKNKEKIITVHQKNISLMEVATDNSIEGIEGICGGCLSCATCHVYIDDIIRQNTTQPLEEEVEMLETTPGYDKKKSRLSCQINVVEGMDGALVTIPDDE